MQTCKKEATTLSSWSLFEKTLLIDERKRGIKRYETALYKMQYAKAYTPNVIKGNTILSHHHHHTVK